MKAGGSCRRGVGSHFATLPWLEGGFCHQSNFQLKNTLLLHVLCMSCLVFVAAQCSFCRGVVRFSTYVAWQTEVSPLANRRDVFQEGLWGFTTRDFYQRW